MATRLTPFAKLLITVLIVGGVFFGVRYFLNNTDAGKSIKDNSVTTDNNNNNDSSSDSDGNTINVGVVTWGGYAGGQYFNEGFKANTNSRFYKDYGFKVDFKILDDFEASRAAWKKGDVDLLWSTVDAFPTEVTALKDFDPVIVFQSDWSRGGDAIVVRRGINRIGDLKGKKVAVAELTPSHSFLIWLLKANGMTANDIEIVPQANAVDAAQVFKSQQVDAAVVWSPDDEACVKSVSGAKVLESTRSASNIIADVFIAKKAWVEKNSDKVRKLYEGWMIGAAEINSSDANKRKAAKILSDNFPGFSVEDTYSAINNVRLCTHGDNQNFFGLNPSYKGVKGEELYTRMSDEYKSLGYIKEKVPSFRLASYPSLVQNTDLSGPENAAETQKKFNVVTNEEKTKDAIATRRVSISFRSGESQLDDNAKYIVDKEFVEIAKAFSNSKIRVEGNTDNVGSALTNRALSLKRAQSVVDYLVSAYGMPRNRFVIVGNGPDNPIASNDTEDGRSKNRRTDFELIGQ
ncbi:MAG: OmpA family protein [Saprospiraceae bacterium]|nr:OmpA family protein [Saprospiraceae bacterium]